MTIPLFKTHFSIGRSILQPKDIFDIKSEYNLSEIVVVEDSFYGFRSINNVAQELGIKLIFGIRLSVVENSFSELPSKLIFFAKNNDGINNIKALYSKTFENKEIVLNLSEVDELFFNNVKIGVPFYDSYIYNNLFYFGLSHLELSKFDHFYFIEDNNHPFDFFIKNQVNRVTMNGSKQPIQNAKSIYYKNKEDFEAFQMYKAICNRSNGKNPSYSNPNLNHFCSNEFCWQSYLENHAPI